MVMVEESRVAKSVKTTKRQISRHKKNDRNLKALNLKKRSKAAHRQVDRERTSVKQNQRQRSKPVKNRREMATEWSRKADEKATAILEQRAEQKNQRLNTTQNVENGDVDIPEKIKVSLNCYRTMYMMIVRTKGRNEEMARYDEKESRITKNERTEDGVCQSLFRMRNAFYSYGICRSSQNTCLAYRMRYGSKCFIHPRQV